MLRIKEPDRARGFRVPGGMIIPILGIISCLYLIYYLPPTSWLRFAAWLNFGFVIYVGYGAVRSHLTGRHLAENKAEHDAHTAYTGAMLGIIGTLLLVLTRAFDIYIVASKWAGLIPDPAGNKDALERLGEMESWLTPFNSATAIGSPGSQLFSSEPWLHRSWFLIIPLALNAVVLYPTVIRRARRALAGRTSERAAASARFSLAVAAILAVITIIYLVIVLTHSQSGN